jgi:hypothetical protein
MPGGKFDFERSAQSEQLAAAAASQGIPIPGVTPAAPGANDILSMLGGQGGLDPKMLMALLSLLAGMGPQGAPGQGQPGAGQPQSPIEAAYGA